MTVFLILPGLSLSAERLVIVGFHQKPGPSERALVRRSKGNIKRTYHLIPAMAVSLTEKEIEKMKKDKNVAYVEDNAIFMTAADEYISAWGVSHIGAEAIHISLNKGAGVKIAVIDTGIDYTHEDLDGNYAGGYDFVFNDTDPHDDNWQSHGSHVSGIIAAEENGIGVVGVAPEADLYAVKVLDGAGFGLVEWVIAGIEWAVDNGMDIANLSLQGPDVQSLHDACDAAYNAGLLLVAAGGNTYGGSVSYPAAYGSVIAVTGTDAGDLQAYFSPVGPELELAAPGVDILSTVTVVNGSYSLLSGTSQAAPHVTGTAALFFLANPHDANGNGMIHDEVREMLQITALDLGESGLDNIYGYGLVNAESVSGFDCPDSDGDSYVACYGVCDPGVLQCGECDDSNENVNPLALEICDGIDNNCDGSTDEGFPELGTSCSGGVGACETAGSYICTADSLSTECDAILGIPGTEGPGGDPTCTDTIDNDCDGLTDEIDPDCKAPPVRQSIGIFDGDFTNLQEADCRLCHDNSSDSTSNVDRHHLLYGQSIPEDSVVPNPDADNDGIPDATYGCLNCHDQDTSGGVIIFLVERNCLQCHQQTPHHETEQALAGDCVFCHGDLVDNMDDGHAIPTYSPSLITPNPSGGGGEPLNNRGNGAGACNYCHDSDGLEPSVIQDNMTTHHNTGFGSPDGPCNWCHKTVDPISTDEDVIRTCEGCHGPESLHNIQADSPNDANIGSIVVGSEDAGYGHVGRDVTGDSDCWGCHGFGMASAPGSGPITPSISSADPIVIVTGTNTQVTLTGAAFTNIAIDDDTGDEIHYTSNVVLTATDDYTIELTPDAIAEGTLTVTIPGTTYPGNYTLQAVKADFATSNPVVLSVTPEVVINNVVCSKCLGTMTITGSGFTEKPAGTDEDINVAEGGRPLNVVNWTDSTIQASGARCRGTVIVNALFGSATYQK